MSGGVSSHIQKALLALINLSHLWLWREIRLLIEGRVYAAAVRLAPLWGSETLRFRAGLRRLSVFEYCCLRSSGRMWWVNFFGNSEVRGNALGPGVQSLDKRQKRNRLKWVGHVLRMTTERLICWIYFPVDGSTQWMKRVQTLASYFVRISAVRRPVLLSRRFTPELVGVDKRCGCVAVSCTLVLNIFSLLYIYSGYYFAGFFFISHGFPSFSRRCCEVVAKTRTCWCNVNDCKNWNFDKFWDKETMATWKRFIFWLIYNTVKYIFFFSFLYKPKRTSYIIVKMAIMANWLLGNGEVDFWWAGQNSWLSVWNAVNL